MVNRKSFGATLWRYRNLLVIIITPLVLLPLPLLVAGQESQCGYIMLIMAVYWCTESMPLSVTGMIPIFVMPMLGILKSDDVAVLYMQESTLMFLGGLMVALGFEKCNLHRRIALAVLVVMGVKPIWLMFGFMFPTWFLSMWISNTATTAMMLPILEAVLVKLGDSMKSKQTRQNSETFCSYDNQGMDGLSSGSKETMNCNEARVDIRFSGDTEIEVVPEAKTNSFHLKDVESGSSDDDGSLASKQNINSDPQFIKLSKGITLAVAYAANIGGTATLTGTTPKIVMKDFADDLWMENLCKESPVNFSSWMVYSVPTSLITVLIIWLWISIFYLGPSGFTVCCDETDTSSNESEITADIRQEFKSLGKMSYAEWFVLFIFVAMILLWFFRSPGFITGWADVLRPGYIKDSVVSIMCTVALFTIPMDPLKWGSEKKLGKSATLLDWDIIHERFPWSVIFLVGGGFALAEAALVSGLSDVIGEALTVFDVLPEWFMVTVIAFIAALLTEVTSNTATCTLLMPIVANMAEEIGLNPLYLMFPTAVATSYAFMLPVSTPPNAIAFSYGRITVLDMVKTGAVLKLTVFVLTLASETWGAAYFSFHELPWDANSTAPCMPPTQVLF